MKIRTVEYSGTLAKPGGEFPDTLPQIALLGRSNVGKSSLINTLLRRTRSKLAHVSATPGKTKTINFFLVNERFFLVDLPGYGYARAPKHMRESWLELIDWYLRDTKYLKGLVHLIDARRKPTKHDLEMASYLSKLGIPALAVLTKMDKLKKSQCLPAVERACKELALDEDQVVPFSSKTGVGRKALLEALDDLLTEAEVA